MLYNLKHPIASGGAVPQTLWFREFIILNNWKVTMVTKDNLFSEGQWMLEGSKSSL